jgi:hypothetical protein
MLLNQIHIVPQFLEAVNRSGTRDVRLMYLESIYNLSMIEETAPEMIRHGLIITLAETF